VTIGYLVENSIPRKEVSSVWLKFWSTICAFKEADGPPIVEVVDNETNHLFAWAKQLILMITRIKEKNFFITGVLIVSNCLICS
jgi:hypothetical protein